VSSDPPRAASRRSIRAAVLREVGKPVSIEAVDLEGPHPGEVRLRIAASGICRSDLSVANGTLQSPLPVVLGHEAAGVVLESGEGVRAPSPGDRVVVALSPECGECVFCREGKPNLCLQMVPGLIHSTLVDGTTRLRAGDAPIHHLSGVASFAEEAIVDARCCIPVPDDVRLERVCLLGCGVLTGAGAAIHTAGAGPGMTLAVIGCGGVGLAAIQGARIAGAERIVAVDVDTGKLELARELGATHAVDGREDVPRRMREIAPLGVHAAIEAIGRTETIETAWAILRPGGLAVVVGMPAARERVGLRVGGFFVAKRIAGCVYGGGHAHRDIPWLIELHRRGELRLDPLVSEELPLERVQEGLDAIARGEGARHVVVSQP
jgi:S-(hydroxymethyl)glutathione dehydrogenase/alcohol dehydrogenase